MGDTRAALRTEIVAVGDPRTEMLAILKDVYRRVKDGQVVGLMVISELSEGAYAAATASVSSTDNLAERIGRLELLKLQLVARARED